MNTDLIRQYRQYRKEGQPATVALSSARFHLAPPAYPWLAGFGPMDCKSAPAHGIIGPFEVRVWCERDDESRLGEDDATGVFTDTWSEGCIPTGGRTGNDYKWYRPSNYTLEHAYDDLRRRGMSKQEARHAYDRQVQEEMAEDRERTWWGVVATVSVGGIEVGQASLWGIDETPSYDPARYLRDVAEEVIAEAIHSAREAIPTTIADTMGAVADLHRAFTPTVSLVKGSA